MGYILPVNNYQYEQYTLRDIGRKTNPYKQQEVFRLFPIPDSLEKRTSMQTGEEYLQKEESKEKRETAKNKEVQELIAKATGKGTHIDLFV
ncbi:hypothetical protein [Niallia sp. NCCP-28]|uniref:hypothetical protein n=1 Tax=Niallia sp. NCCP-28 TaxID=2934712 RepID=UPI00208098FC|nr:hypothetical protein [Niallia sp. NCCP-28]GKU81830.1 hypothetical protein NCCP28_12260 [Niallia sp. NCCP-28]